MDEKGNLSKMVSFFLGIFLNICSINPPQVRVSLWGPMSPRRGDIPCYGPTTEGYNSRVVGLRSILCKHVHDVSKMSKLIKILKS